MKKLIIVLFLAALIGCTAIMNHIEQPVEKKDGAFTTAEKYDDERGLP